MKTGVSGRSRQLAALCSLIIASQLAGCGGGSDRDSTPTTPPLSNSPPVVQPEPPAPPAPPAPPEPPAPPAPEPTPVAKANLKLTGKVTDEPIPNALVTATVGDETFTTTADATGAYSLDIEIDEADVDGFVTLAARGVGAQSYVEFKSLVGSFASLVTDAGSDGTLASEENFATQITNVSTAQAVFMELANGGQPITTDGALQQAAGQVNAQDVLDLATAIKLAVDEPETNPLPNGQTSILALASSPTARQSFVNEIYENSPTAFAATQVSIAQDPQLAQNTGALQRYLDNEGFTTAMLSSDALFSFNYTGRIAHFDLYADGTGSESSQTYYQEYTWELDGSSIAITYDAPVTVNSYESVDCQGTFAQIPVELTSEGVTLTMLGERAVAITTTEAVAYPTCPSLDGERTTTAARTILSLDNFKVIDTAELAGNAQTIYVWDSTKGAVVADIAELNGDGTGTALLTNQTFTWEMNADGGPEETGKIIRAEFEGWSAEYLAFRDIDALASDIFWEVRVGNDGADGIFMGAGASVFADPEYAVEFTDADVAGHRFYQFGKGEEGVDDARLGGFRLRFDANGVGAQEIDHINLSNAVVLDASATFRWKIVEGPVGVEVVVSRTYDTVAQAYNNCAVGSTGCIVFDERRIIPMVADDERVYWVEVRRIAGPGEALNDVAATHLVRFYDREPNTAPAVIAKHKRSSDVSLPRKLLDGAMQH